MGRKADSGLLSRGRKHGLDLKDHTASVEAPALLVDMNAAAKRLQEGVSSVAMTVRNHF